MNEDKRNKEEQWTVLLFDDVYFNWL